MPHLLALAAATDPQTPPDNSVIAGPWGFFMLLLLIGLIAFLGWSFVQQKRKVDDAADQGLYDPSPEKSQAHQQMDGLRTSHAPVVDKAEPVAESVRREMAEEAADPAEHS